MPSHRAPLCHWLPAGVTALVLTTLAAGAVEGQVSGNARPTLFEPVAVFATRRLGESSGVAVSRAHAGILWTHNDSGDGPFVYATNLEGADLGRFRVAGARAVDWEDIALGPCLGASAACLYIADTGDNEERRATVALYIVPEPDPSAEPRRSATAPARRVVLAFRGGPRDAEALAVTPDGTVLLISKGRTGRIEVFRLDPEQMARDTLEVAPWIELPIDPRRALGRLVTGAAASPDGRTLVVRTYTELFFFALGEPDGVALLSTCWLGLVEPQGEAVDFLDDRTLVLTSESALGRAGGISRVQCATAGPKREGPGQ
jgi:hypothetical protein